jgi:hypothetical protein
MWGNILFQESASREEGKKPLDHGFIAVEHPRKVADIIRAQGWAANATWK